MEWNIERIEALLLIAGIVSMLARKLRLPYSVGLVLAGIGLALSPIRIELALTRELVFSALLPPLLFEAAFHVEWSAFRRDLSVILALATVGVFISLVVIAAGVALLFHWHPALALLLGVLLSATDPVAVLAIFKETKVSERLRLLVDAESLLNDGTVAVLFVIAMAAIAGEQLTPTGVVTSFVFTALGGMVCGALTAGLVLGLAGHTEDPLVEITFTTIAAYGSFMLAEYFHFSGVLATLTAGVMVGTIGSIGAISDKGREAVIAFWEFMGFVANSIIFLLIGVQLTRQNFHAFWYPALMVILLTTLGRALTVYLCCGFFSKTPQRVSRSHQHALFWGGLRGALSLALALGLPVNLVHREEIITIVFAVVAFSILVQGSTIAPVMKFVSRKGSVQE